MVLQIANEEDSAAKKQTRPESAVHCVCHPVLQPIKTGALKTPLL